VFPQPFKFLLGRHAQLLIVVAASLVMNGCTTNGAKETEETDIWAAYSVEEILEAGDAAFDSGQNERAVFIYMQALEIEQSAETWYRIGIGKARLGDKAYAWQALKQAIELNPDHALSHQEIGLIDMAMGDPRQAELHLAKATEIDPTLWRAWNARGVIADIDHRYAEAVLLYQSGLIGAPNSSLLMNNIGYSYYLAGDLEEATRWFGRAVLATPDYKPAVKNLGLLYAREGWYDEAVRTFSKVVDKPQAFNDVGYIALRNGDYEKATELLTEAIRLSPTYYEKAYENLENVKEALREHNRELADANDLGNVSQVIFPDGKGPEKRSVMTRALNVRGAPNSDSKIVNYLRNGDEVEVITTMPGWAFVNYRPGRQGSNLTGWVNSNYLSGIADESESGSSQKTSAAAAAPKAKAEKPVAQEIVVSDETGNPALVIQTDQAPPAGGDKMPVTEQAGGSALEAESVIKLIDAVCELSDQTEKTPHTAGSCIGVASANADE